MQNLGYTRSSLRPDHYLQTPDTFIRAPLPAMKNATAIVHAGPANGARFTFYTAEMQAGGMLGPADLQRFFYVLEGSVEVEGKSLDAGGYGYASPNCQCGIHARQVARLVVMEKQFVGDVPKPSFFTGEESALPEQPLMGDSALRVRALIPDSQQFDFAVNIMTFDPGASLGMVEMHVMEHGLLMLEGGGIYRLSDCWYPVTAGDFIYMGPFCPQWFGALGKSPARYLIYKDWNRHPAAL